MLKYGVTVTKCTLGCIQRKDLSCDQVECIKRVEAVLKFYAVGTDVLHWRSPYRARNQGQIFKAWPSLRQAPSHELMPVFSCTSLHNPGFVCLGYQTLAHDFHFENERLDVARQHNVAATAQYTVPFGVVFESLLGRHSIFH